MLALWLSLVAKPTKAKATLRHKRHRVAEGGACEIPRGDAGNAGAAGPARLGIEHAQDFCGSHFGSFV